MSAIGMGGDDRNSRADTAQHGGPVLCHQSASLEASARHPSIGRARLPFSPDPLLLSRTERVESWLWSKRWPHALFGWVLQLFPVHGEPDDLRDVLVLMAAVTVSTLVIAALSILFGRP